MQSNNWDYEGDPIVHIDLAKSKTDREATAKKLVGALQEEGFVYLDNVPDFNPDEVLQHAKWFFSISEKEKWRLSRREWNPESKAVYHGYSPLVPGEPSWKEIIEFGCDLEPDDPDAKMTVLYEPNVWPNEEGEPKFRNFMKKYYDTMTQSGIEVTRLIALGLGMDEHAFDDMFLTKPLSTLRLLRYPPRPEPIPEEFLEGDYVIVTCDHADSTFLTMLATFDYAGLQIKDKYDKWINVPPRRNSLVLNVGDTLVELVGGLLKATHHRVVDLRDRDRFSVPFFVEPNFHAVVGVPLIKSKDYVPTRSKPIEYGYYLVERYKTKGHAEYKNTNFFPESEI